MSRTLGQFIEDEEIVPWITDNVARINRASGRGAAEVGKQLKLAVSCTNCKATKICCWSFVVARLYEGVIIASELRRTKRDSPELRDQLKTRAELMEASSPYEWRSPCLFLGPKERCTVYDVRPTSCGALYVYTPPEICASQAREIKAYVATTELATAHELEEPFRQKLNLRLKVGRRYVGVLPRMVLVALETWDRDDFRDHLRQLPWPGEAELARWSPG